MPSRYAPLSRAELAVLVPELLLIGHLIDRAGMPYCLEAWGEEQMTQVAIEEWAGASPIYTRRMQRALRFEGDDVPTIFKGMQLDIGAPPQFMDFRYSVADPWHGAFHLDHCGALLDVEPMGPAMVKNMCHDIEDPTFDATAVATNPRAQVRPVHRPPRTPADRTPHCAWTVEIDPSFPVVEALPALADIERTRAATLDLDPIDPAGDGLADYSGALVDDLDFAAFSHSALVRIADEVVLQNHLLNLSFQRAVRARAGDDEGLFRRIALSQLVGHAGVAAERLHRALGLGSSPEDAATLLELHPLMNPLPYVDLVRDGAAVTVAPSPAHEDGGWPALCGPDAPDALRAIVRAADPHLDVEVTGTPTAWTARVVVTGTAAPEPGPVAVTKISKGAAFAFEPRRSLPLYVR
ncbi:hypothetical protein [Actinomadura parmotrematis]|uniref:Uncharacterized protein n=1 Tax=Actinomadura parmotrematis TaxID=2864039 RepID=A0ABS7G5J7_9ACTN|nr:hypothetical protein [Actinomadura parmotrematis]MBW8487500.1 hypothetical protein [Actinomadura parmotrematis]